MAPFAVIWLIVSNVPSAAAFEYRLSRPSVTSPSPSPSVSSSSQDPIFSHVRRRALLSGVLAVPSVLLPHDRSNDSSSIANAVVPSDGGGGTPSLPLASPAIRHAVQHLWDLDAPNRLTPGVEYEVDVQSGKRPYGKPLDAASRPLFVRVDSEVFRRRPTYKAFVSLLDNYAAEVNTTDIVTAEEEAETRYFINEVMRTDAMRFCHAFCRSERPEKVPADPSEFSDLLHKLWFKQYKRTKGGVTDSCGFEHVFVGETRNGQITGFHNWIRFFLEEQRGALDYRGYIKPKNDYDACTDGNDQVLTLQFVWNGAEKLVGTSFIGVSPEFELALYTLCFLAGQHQNVVELKTRSDTFNLNVKTFPIAKGKIGSSFVEELGHNVAEGACRKSQQTRK